MSLMVPVGDSKLGSTEIHFIEPGVKVNGAYYRINLLAQKLLQDIFWISQVGFFVFQQDDSSSTRHRRFLERKVTFRFQKAFKGAHARLHSTPHSTDLSSVDYL